jgi:hypothetical protein
VVDLGIGIQKANFGDKVYRPIWLTVRSAVNDAFRTLPLSSGA